MAIQVRRTASGATKYTVRTYLGRTALGKRQFRVETFPSRQAAVAAERQFDVEKRKSPTLPRPLSVVAREHALDVERRASRNYACSVQTILLRAAEFFGDPYVNRIAVHEWEAWIEDATVGCTVSTRKAYRTAVTGMLRYAGKRGYVSFKWVGAPTVLSSAANPRGYPVLTAASPMMRGAQ
jgi:hypothetical protein